MQTLREAAWEERALDIIKRDLTGAVTERRIWPLGTVFPDRKVQCPAFCCLRRDFRRFKVQQIDRVALTDESLRPCRVPLLRAFIERLRTEGRRPTPA